MTNAELAIRLDERQRCMAAMDACAEGMRQYNTIMNNGEGCGHIEGMLSAFKLAIRQMDDEAGAREIARDVKQPQRENV